MTFINNCGVENKTTKIPTVYFTLNLMHYVVIIFKVLNLLNKQIKKRESVWITKYVFTDKKQDMNVCTHRYI